jgi:CBS domain-containing protein
MRAAEDPRAGLTDTLSRASVQRISDAVRSEVLHKSADQDRQLLDLLQLRDGDALTAQAEGLYEAAFIDGDQERAKDLCRRIMLDQPLTQVLLQSLAGRPSMTFSGVQHLLARHGMARLDQASMLRRFLGVLNEVDIVAYAKKSQTVRSTTSGEDVEVPRIRVVQPGRNYSNVMHLRRIIRDCEDYIWWAEPHLNGKALEPLADEINPDRVKSVRMLSGPVAINESTRRDWHRFQREMAEAGVDAQWRVLPKGRVPFHDRYLLGRNQAWNVPPINTVYKGSYSEATRCDARPPFETWWVDGESLEEMSQAA